MDKTTQPGPRRFLPFLLLIVFFCQPAWAEKTDIVYLKNGDRITGEVKNLTRGKLEFKTDHMGTVFIEWEHILQLTSNTGQSIELTDGRRFYGTLTKADDDDKLTISTPVGQVDVDLDGVFAMYPVKANFWDRLDINVDFGLNWDKGSQVGKYNLGMDATLKRTESISKLKFSTEITTQANADNTSRAELSGLHNVFKPGKRFSSYFANLDRNDKLGIDLRALVGAGYGWVPLRSQRNWFSFALGADVNREIPTEGADQTNLEGVGWLTYEYYKFDAPERTFTTNLLIFPGITDWGRWRLNFNSIFKLELVQDLYWKMDIYASYDNKPISPDASTSDYGVTTSIGYKF